MDNQGIELRLRVSRPDRRELFMSLFLVWSGCDLGGHSMFMFLCFLFLCVRPGMVLNQGQLSIVVSNWESYLGSFFSLCGNLFFLCGNLFFVCVQIVCTRKQFGRCFRYCFVLSKVSLQ